MARLGLRSLSALTLPVEGSAYAAPEESALSSTPWLKPESGRLKTLIEDYERDLILSALVAAGGQQRRAAAALGVLPTTLNEKLKRLGLRPSAAPAATESPDEFRWEGALLPGSTLEVRGVNGHVRAERAVARRAEVVARKSGPANRGTVEIKAVEDGRNVVVGAHYSLATVTARGPLPRGRNGRDDIRVDFRVRVPDGVRFVARTLKGDVEVIGVEEVELHTPAGTVSLSRRSAVS